jgi:oligoribonuclease NrnB/cAMP/cGMP phosphodiesterase (DHH superfamily)
MLNRDLPLVVIYHGGGCRDGFCSAYLVSRAFPNAEFVPANYGDDPPNVAGKQVLIADFSYDADILFSMQNDCVGDVVILDHHTTAESKLAEFQERCETAGLGKPHIEFDLTMSGAMLTWRFLDRHGLFQALKYKRAPKLVRYVQDRDLWKYELPDSKMINEGIRLEPLTFEAWEQLEGRVEYLPSLVRDAGIIVQKRNQQIIDSHLNHAETVTFCGHVIRIVNCTVDLTSEICGALAVGIPFAMTYFDNADGDRVYSLRSAPDGVDVSEIAKQFGGGGHRHAAGFRWQCVKSSLVAKA